MALLLDVDPAGRLAVVVGAGPAGREKIDRLLAAGATVRVVDPSPPDDLAAGVEVVGRRFEPGDVAGAWLVVAATADVVVNDAVERAARDRGAWVTRADRRDGGGVAFVATVARGPVTVGVSTGGTSPTLSRWVRDRVATALPEAVGELAAILADRPRRDGRRGHRGLPLDDALDALVAGDGERARTLLDAHEAGDGDERPNRR